MERFRKIIDVTAMIAKMFAGVVLLFMFGYNENFARWYDQNVLGKK